MALTRGAAPFASLLAAPLQCIPPDGVCCDSCHDHCHLSCSHCDLAFTPQVALLSFAHLCARAVTAFGYVVGFTQMRTAGWLVGAIANAALYVMLLEFATAHNSAS